LCDGTVTLTVIGGQAPYTIAWSANLFGSTDLVQENLCPDTYCFTVTDANGCSQSGCVTITQAPILIVGSNCCPNNIRCHNGCDGKIDITVFGGTRPFVYHWEGPNGFTSSDSDLVGLCPGMYSVTVVDANGCTYDHTHAPLENPDSIISNITSTDNTNCDFDPCNGTVAVAPVGGKAPYKYAWSTGATTASLSEVCGGTYVVTVTDVFGCTIVDSVDVTDFGCNLTPPQLAKKDNFSISVFPNPFEVSTTITFVSSKDDDVSLEIFSVSGQKITELFKGGVKAGIPTTVNYTNTQLSQGLYFYRLAGSKTAIKGNIIITR